MKPTEEKRYESLSPFELKNKLIQMAKSNDERMMLNAGRGNPNWLALEPRFGFFLFGKFALSEAKRVSVGEGFGGLPEKNGIGGRLQKFLAENSQDEGVDFLRQIFSYVVDELKYPLDDFVYEMVDGICGDHYPVPDRMLSYSEKVVQKYLKQEMLGGRDLSGTLDLFATEGGTAAMSYIFNSLMENKLLQKGDKIALGCPIFTPYLEIPKLNDFEFVEVAVSQDEESNWQYPDSEIEKLNDPDIKAFFLVNPSNPTSVRMQQSALNKIGELVKTKRQDLILLTDDVYGTFVDGFRSLMDVAPHNTILVYSFSKYFGATGWRLGVIGICGDNIFDKKIAELQAEDRQELAERYGSTIINPDKMKFIDRMVADSRLVALHHTAGLSTPQQVMMVFFSLFCLLDKSNDYKRSAQVIVAKRHHILYEALGITSRKSHDDTHYYTIIDIPELADERYGKDFADYLLKQFEPIDFVVKLAEELKETKEAIKKLAKLAGNIKKEKKGVTKTLKKIRELSTENKKALVLEEEKIGDLGLTIICNSLLQQKPKISCRKLDLRKSKITTIGAKVLAKTIQEAQQNPQQFNMKIREIDLRGNNIDEEGIQAIAEALKNNFTITKLKYDTKDINNDIKNNIEKQLLINRHLQRNKNSIADQLLTKKYHSQGIDISEAAKKKIKDNFKITAFSATKNNDLSELIDKTIKQNKLFWKLSTDKKPTAEDYVDAYGLDPKRCDIFLNKKLSGFMADELSHDQQEIKIKVTKELVEESIRENPTTLHKLDYAKSQKLLESIFTPPRSQSLQNNIKLLAKILSKLPQEAENNSPIIMAMKATIEKAFNHLDKQKENQFRKRFEQKRKDIAKSGLNVKTKRKILNIIDSNLNQESEIGKIGSLKFKEYQLQKLLEEQPLDSATTFEVFTNIYQEIDLKQLHSIKLNPNKVAKLVMTDFKSEPMNHTLLRGLDKKHRLTLLQLCFHKEKEEEKTNRAGLIDRIIKLSSPLEGTAEKELDYDNRNNTEKLEHIIFTAFNEPNCNYNKLKGMLEEQRNRLVTKKEDRQADLVEKILQETLQEELTKNLNNLKKLKEILNDNFILREFEFPSKIDKEVKSYLENIIARNITHDIMHNEPLTSTQKIELLADILSGLDDDQKQRQEFLETFIKIAGNSLLETIKHDIDKNQYKTLRSIPEKLRTELLAASLKQEMENNNVTDKSHHQGIAVMVAKLISTKPPISEKYIWQMFTWPGTIYGKYKRWSFQEYIENLKELKETTKSEKLAEKIDEIIQAGLQEDLITRPQSYTELSKNYDLFNFDHKKVTKIKIKNKNQRITKEMINYICQRNLLNKDVATYDLEVEEFIETYKKIPDTKCKEALKTIDKLEVLKIVSKDLGTENNVTCKNLRNLNEKHRHSLLEHCFLINETPKNAEKKATLITSLLNIQELFTKNDEISKEVKKAIYWAITPKGYYQMRKDSPYYTLSELLTPSSKTKKTSLTETLNKIDNRHPLKTKLKKSIEPFKTLKLK